MEKHYWIYYKADLKELLFTIRIFDKAKKNVCNVMFSRNDMMEDCKDNMFLHYLSNRNQYKVVFHQSQMSIAEQCSIHKIFPYIPQFTNLEDFYFWYKRMNSEFDYSKYADATNLACKLLVYPECKADKKWNFIECERSGYLYCKWKDRMNISHIVLLHDEFFVSDLSYWQICKQEIEMDFYSDVSDVQLFIKERPQAMLDKYLNAGGRKTFSFLTARIMNHPMELLGKAGLAKLADNIDQYQDIYKEGKTLSEIFGVPLLVLKSVNKGEDLMLCTLEDRCLLGKTFEENRAVFSEPMSVIGELWIRYYYLNNQTNYRTKNGGDLLDTIRYLNKCCKNEDDAYTVFGLYQNYLAYGERIGGNYIHGLYPKDLLKAVEESVSILQIKYEEGKFREFQKAVKEDAYQSLKDDLPDCRYRIKVPETPEEIRLAAKKLHNCLKEYILKVRNRETMIVFIEDKQQANKLVGAIEVCSGKLAQASSYRCEKLSKELNAYLQDYVQRNKYFAVGDEGKENQEA